MARVRKRQTVTLTVGSLFSGIGGLDLGLERAGMRVIWQSEIDPYASRVLAKHWKDVPNYGDIKQIDWSAVERPDVICGGYPCQPFSQAGHRRGTDDPRHLFPWVLNAISRLRPRYAILENVRGHLSMGGTEVIGSLASIGYDCEWELVSAASQGAPHIRERVFIVAYPNSSHTPNGRQCQDVPSTNRCREHDRSRSERNTWQIGLGSPGQIASALSNNERERNGQYRFSADASIFGGQWDSDQLRKATNDSRQWWATEPNVGRVADGVPNRVDRLRGLGNAVVPQVAEFVGRLVMAHAA